MSKLSPMMEHYKELKAKYPDTILMYRLGDFYEMFFDDAAIASEILDLTLTGRDCGLKERAPMCGVPYHAVDGYISKLVSAGKKVAICEQLSAVGEQKGMLKRDIVRIVTAGTVTDEQSLENKSNNYLSCFIQKDKKYAISWLDLTTGEFKVKDFPNDTSIEEVEDFLLTLSPSEIIVNEKANSLSNLFPSQKSGRLPKFSLYYDYAFDFDNARKVLLKQLNTFELSALGLEDNISSVCAAGGILDYINTTQKQAFPHINKLNYLRKNDFMYLDYNTKRNLELLSTMMDNKVEGSLLWVLDRTKTNMGGRYLKKWISMPLQSLTEIELRQNAVAELFGNIKMREGVGNLLIKVKDLERLTGKISAYTITPRECLSLKDSLKQIPYIKNSLKTAKSTILNDIFNNLDPLSEVVDLLEKAIKNDAPINLKDGKYINDNYNPDLDYYRNIKNDAAELVNKYEAEQKKSVNINSLKIAYNRIFGYYIEIPNSKASEAIIPFNYRRKQTVASGERYTTDELDKIQNDILTAEEKTLFLESSLYAKLKDYLQDFIQIFQKTAVLLGTLDCLYSLSTVAVENGYVKPKMTKNYAITILDGRHPVVEALKKRNEFVPNDTELSQKSSTMIITGPNMAGKSTYIRQVALITLMAHIGGFVPAKKAEICLVDRIFTRIGASDNLGLGQSTFMVEMLEMANILNNATGNSLLILDEIGRGTSTLDGLSIAWAIVEHLSVKLKAKTLFATHYHELSELEFLLDGIKNYRILVQETKDSISFVYKISRGGANKSFGIEVASLAGVKKEIIIRSKDIMKNLTESHEVSKLKDKLSENPTDTAIVGNQLSLFEEDPKFVSIKKILSDIDVNRCTPIEALTILSDLKKIINKD